MFSWLEKNPFFFAVGVFIVIAYAGIVEILPDFANRARPLDTAKPYTVLQLAGKNIYMQDGCNTCHTQMIRPFKSETDRYGMYSISGEYAYDRPHLWGSKRTGPDLWRVGNYRTSDWHENHMKDPTSVVPGSIMPAYTHMFKKAADIKTAYAEALTVQKVFNAPYNMPDMPKLGSWEETQKDVLAEAGMIVDQMRDEEIKKAFANGEIREIVALIAYLNSLK
ncbi:cytochrome-c oxidase, cbb3-type subunit II [Campylobacter sp. RM9344]|uniref:Cytochrome-c oxidase, cbb3-type subunit II n=1 Tax=Campylobacter californiensis TaxID=1032243 RepID=A0AAW3ZTX8_9BACT|nr:MULTISPECIES: cytochrome-c oxidase, cbb3-type subunit II [unclassified Campylobacter]MBE2984522.1 cytochrome-c oxidase, cbb3-type subunit II [Campylobacter sp. RM6883]MBE2994948.1 cytochrome-c oxidase, cbb3-type subunit II [Campylobacter sp. RM6913]MBE3022964.1 cytochrome-c oxidase, cbb3-type subunit II [Campylobacter sp. 7477a]MBE3028963.1 cytochrome-c oxidase, cbb3-type subunit II [Campylobacter sp. RM9344]MBE3607321.1 cytochrome-c oxidase, cbb3-type subunit II [Campylobacter sp. RM9337]